MKKNRKVYVLSELLKEFASHLFLLFAVLCSFVFLCSLSSLFLEGPCCPPPVALRHPPLPDDSATEAEAQGEAEAEEALSGPGPDRLVAGVALPLRPGKGRGTADASSSTATGGAAVGVPGQPLGPVPSHTDPWGGGWPSGLFGSSDSWIFEFGFAGFRT